MRLFDEESLPAAEYAAAALDVGRTMVCSFVANI